MINLFKKSIEQRIFNDVYSAEGLILEEANRVLANPPQFTKEQESRLQKLKLLGFDSFDEVKKLEKQQSEFVEHSALKRIIRYYNFVYPFNRFISQDSVKVILKKYKLILAKAGDYIAEIPEKNQNEIINFKIMRKDVREPDEIRSGNWGVLSIPSYVSFDFGHRNILCETAIPNYKEIKKREAAEKKAKDREMIPGKDLLIVAPQHKLNTFGREIKNGILRIKDPIVLQPVHLGYLIVSSWGLEASDPLVVNQRMN